MYSKINYTCGLCQMDSHQEKDCNLILYNPDKVKIFLKNQYSDRNEARKNKKRKRRKAVNTVYRSNDYREAR
jgi:hypothetical protein